MLRPFSCRASTSLGRALRTAQPSTQPLAATIPNASRASQSCSFCGSALLRGHTVDIKGKGRAVETAAGVKGALGDSAGSLSCQPQIKSLQTLGLATGSSRTAHPSTNSLIQSGRRALTTAANSQPSSHRPPPARPRSAQRYKPRRAPRLNNTTLDQLITSLRTGAHTQLAPDLLSLSPDAQLALTRNTFDRAFPLALAHSASTPALTWELARRLAKLADQRDWDVDRAQHLAILQAGVRWAEWTKSLASPPEDRAGTVQWKLLRKVGLSLAEQVGGSEVEPEERVQVVEWLVRMALARVRRTPAPGAAGAVEGEGQAEDVSAPPPSTSAAAFAVNAYQTALSLSQPCATATPTTQGTAILTALLTSHPTIALRHLDNLLHANLIPTLAGLEAFLLSPAATASTIAGVTPSGEDPYAHARAILDSACDSGRSSGRWGRRAAAPSALDELLAARLRRIERDAAVAEEPMLEFLKWLAGEWPTVRLAEAAEEEKVGKEEALGAAMRVWRTVYGQGRADQAPRAVNVQALEQLVKDACELQHQHARASQDAAPSAALATTHLAVELAKAHLPPAVMSNLSHRLLDAVAVDAADGELAHGFYDSLRMTASSTSAKPFQWHTSLRHAFASLILSAEKEERPERVMQLYADWTGDGLVLPADLWTNVWRAAGQRSLVEEVARLAADYEDAGRGRLPPRLVAVVMEASANERRVVKTLRLLSYFRSRPRHAGAFGRKGRSAVPLEAYEAVLAMLSSSATDRRAAAMEVFSAALADGHSPTTSTWNHLLAAQVFRPAFHVEDVDNAGLAFNSLIQAGCAPDARTYSLLMHGFLRLARSRQGKTGVGLHAALRAYHQAARAGLAVRGEGVAGLMRELGRRGRWEEAKEVGEKWWRLRERALRKEGRRVRSAGEEDGGVAAAQREAEMEAVRGAGEEVEWWEKRAVLDGVHQEGAEVEEEAGDEGLAEGGKVEASVEGAKGEEAVDERSGEAFEENKRDA